MARRIARVKERIEETLHYEGAPPGVLKEDFERTLLQAADWVLMDLNKDGVFLIRYSDGGEFGGDTWAPNREVAVEVAADEFGLNESDWIEVPENVADPIGFARTAVGPRI